MSCHKLAFRTIEQAQRTMAIVAAFRPGSQQPIRLYDCPDCGLMHLTSLPQQNRPDDSTVTNLAPVTPLFASTPEAAPTRAERDEAIRQRALARIEERKAEEAAKAAERAAEKARKAAAHAENVANRKRKLQALAEQPAWMKDKAREIGILIWQGDTLSARVIADAIVGLPKQMTRDEAERWFETYAADRFAWHMRPSADDYDGERP